MSLVDPENETSRPTIATPSPGAVCPAMVRLLLAETGVLNVIVPPTSNTTMRDPVPTASRNDPAPESANVVTCTTAPMRPPEAARPKP